MVDTEAEDWFLSTALHMAKTVTVFLLSLVILYPSISTVRWRREMSVEALSLLSRLLLSEDQLPAGLIQQEAWRPPWVLIQC